MIELHEAKRWKCDLPALGADMANQTVAAAWKCVWQFLNERHKRLEAEIVAEALFRSDETAQSAISRRAGEAIYALLDATRRYNLDHTSMLNTLIGLGSGLTPSGDDLLVGYLAGLWCTVQDRCVLAAECLAKGQRPSSEALKAAPSTSVHLRLV